MTKTRKQTAAVEPVVESFRATGRWWESTLPQLAPTPTTLGAARPRTGILSLPGRSSFYWLPCVKTLDGEPHVFFIADSERPHFSCPEHRAPEVASAAPARRTLVDPAPLELPERQEAVEEEVEPDPMEAEPAGEVAGFARAPRGKPPWADDERGAIWEWKRFGPKARAKLRESYEERAGILEFDANLPREYAEYRAYGLLLDQAAQHGIL